jgi:hypothetical protein
MIADYFVWLQDRQEDILQSPDPTTSDAEDEDVGVSGSSIILSPDSSPNPL